MEPNKHIEIVIGRRYHIVDGAGEEHDIEVVGDYGGAYGEGFLEVRIDGAEETVPLMREDLESWLSVEDMKDRRFEPGNEFSVNHHGERHTIVIVDDCGNGVLDILMDGEVQSMAKEQLEEWLSNPLTDDIYAIHTGNRVFDELRKGKDNPNKDKFKNKQQTTKKGITTEGIIGCLIWFLVLGLPVLIGLSIYYCTRQKPNQSNQARKAFVNNTSTQPNREIKQIVITSTNDSLFHYSTICSRLGTSPELSNEYVERLDGKWMCPECGIKEAEYIIHKDEYMQDLYNLDSIYDE